MKKGFMVLFALLLILVSCTPKDIEETIHYGCSDASCFLFSSGLLAVYDGVAWGYVDTTGETVIPLVYEQASAFYDQTALVKLNDQYHLINKSNDILYTFDGPVFRDPISGHLIYKQENLYGLMDKDGQVLTDAIYVFMAYAKDGYFLVYDGEYYGFIDHEGNTQIPLMYVMASSFSQGLAKVEIDGYYGFINKENELIIDAIFTEAFDFTSFGLALAQYEAIDDIFIEETWFLINTNGEPIMSANLIIDFDSHLYLLYKDELWVIYDAINDLFVPVAFSEIIDIVGPIIHFQYFSTERYVMVASDGSILVNALESMSSYELSDRADHTLIVHSGQYKNVYVNDHIIQLDNETFVRATNNGLIVQIDEQYKMLSLNGNVTLQTSYDLVYYFDDHYILYQDQSFYGVLNKQGQMLIEAQYEIINFNLNLLDITKS